MTDDTMDDYVKCKVCDWYLDVNGNCKIGCVRREAEGLRAELASARAHAKQAEKSAAAQWDELERLRIENQKTRAENERLKADLGPLDCGHYRVSLTYSDACTVCVLHEYRDDAEVDAYKARALVVRLRDAMAQVEPHLPQLDSGPVRLSAHAQAAGALRSALSAADAFLALDTEVKDL